MAGQDSFLTGGISRKMHLHARRLKIDAPGAKIDATAELPDHFEQSLDMLGFDVAAGDRLPPRKAEGNPMTPRKPKPQARRGAGRVAPPRRGRPR